jgi:hypothetical protein
MTAKEFLKGRQLMVTINGAPVPIKRLDENFYKIMEEYAIYKLNNKTMSEEQIRELAEKYMTKHLDFVFTNETESTKRKMITAFTLGFLKGEMNQIGKDLEKLRTW